MKAAGKCIARSRVVFVLLSLMIKSCFHWLSLMYLLQLRKSRGAKGRKLEYGKGRAGIQPGVVWCLSDLAVCHCVIVNSVTQAFCLFGWVWPY